MAAAVFPTYSESVASWLDDIKLGKYKESFVSNGVLELSHLVTLTEDQLQLMGIKMVGHRRRIVQARKELNLQGAAGGSTSSFQVAAAAPPAAESGAGPSRMDVDADSNGEGADRNAARPSPAALTGVPRARCYNSTSSIYINSTLMKPDIEELIFCVSVVIHDRVVQGEESGLDVYSRLHFFSEENNPMYADPMSRGPAGAASAEESVAKRTRREVPSEETIFHSLRSVYECARFPSECLIIALVYMERLICSASTPLTVTSWRPILLAGLILAQKVWDDRALHNIDFSTFCPMFTLKEINHLERKFLELIDYDVSVTPSLYAGYYFQLRTLCQRENRQFHLKPMDTETAAKLEARGVACQIKLKKEAGRTWQSANDVGKPRESREPALFAYKNSFIASAYAHNN